MAADEYMTVAEASAVLGDSESTVRRLFDAGALDGYVTERGGHRRISRRSIDQMLGKRRGEGSAAE